MVNVFYIPHADRAIVTTAGEKAAVMAKAQAVNLSDMALEYPQRRRAVQSSIYLP
jgi:hypothetical protein